MILRQSFIAATLAAALASTSAFAADSSRNTNTMGGPGTSATSNSSGATGTGSTANNNKRSSLERVDQNFIENAAQGGFAEVEGSKLAERKGQSADVKAFAATMIKDHTAVNKELATLAKSKGYTPPTQPSLVQRAEIKTLSALSGNAFDKMYVDRIGVAAHESTVKQFEAASTEVKDPELKAFIDKTLPSLRHHLEMAKALNEKQKAQ